MSGITWYDVLGVLPDAAPEDIHAAWQARRAALQPGAWRGLADVLSAADRARQVGGGGLGVLGTRSSGNGMTRRSVSRASGRAWRRPGGGRRGRMSAWARGGPRRMRNHWSRIRIRMPGWSCRMSRGCSTASAWRWPRLGLHVAPIRLTPHPMPVDGLVVGQTPAPGERVHRDSRLTVQVWHPSEPDGQPPAG